MLEPGGLLHLIGLYEDAPLPLGSSAVLSHLGKVLLSYEAEAEGEQPCAVRHLRPDIVERRKQDRQRDARFDQPRRQPDHAERRQGQCDRMRYGECGHDRKHAQQRAAQASDRNPLAISPQQHRRQQHCRLQLQGW